MIIQDEYKEYCAFVLEILDEIKSEPDIYIRTYCANRIRGLMVKFEKCLSHVDEIDLRPNHELEGIIGQDGYLDAIDYLAAKTSAKHCITGMTRNIRTELSKIKSKWDSESELKLALDGFGENLLASFGIKHDVLKKRIEALERPSEECHEFGNANPYTLFLIHDKRLLNMEARLDQMDNTIDANDKMAKENMSILAGRVVEIEAYINNLKDKDHGME